jgi:hypothetical protein
MRLSSAGFMTMTRSIMPQVQGAQILRNEAYKWVRRSDEGCSATQQMGYERMRHGSTLNSVIESTLSSPSSTSAGTRKYA